MKKIPNGLRYLCRPSPFFIAPGVIWLLLSFACAGNAAQSGDFTYTTINGTITITGFQGLPVAIPGTIDGLPVTSIGDSAFYECSSLTSITIPDSVTSIGNFAFAWCFALTGVTIGNSVTSIGDLAFWGCFNLTNVTIGNSVTRIGSGAFDKCYGLTSVTIPKSVTSLGGGAFSRTSLTAITVDALNCVYSSVEGVLLNKSQTSLIQYPPGKAGSYTVPNSVTSIGGSEFSGCWGLTSVTIGNSVTSIGDKAFYNCISLTSVTIGNSVTNIGGGAFESCTSLSKVTIPNSVTSLGDKAFSSCLRLTSVTIGNSVTHIGFWTFNTCGNLTNVTIGNSVTNIGAWAFAGCTSLTSVTIPNRVTRIEQGAFMGCTNLTGVYFQGNCPDIGIEIDAFTSDYKATVYYLPGSTGWGRTLGVRPTVMWNPKVQTNDASFGTRTNQFGFTIIGTSGLVVVVDACTDVTNPTWSPLQTNILSNGSSYFGDPQWTNYPARFYRLLWP